MLILTRRIGESPRISDDIVVRLLEVKGHQVRIGIEAPKDVPVDREGIRDRKVEAPELADGITPLRRTDPADVPAPRA